MSHIDILQLVKKMYKIVQWNVQKREREEKVYKKCWNINSLKMRRRRRKSLEFALDLHYAELVASRRTTTCRGSLQMVKFWSNLH